MIVVSSETLLAREKKPVEYDGNKNNSQYGCNGGHNNFNPY